MCRKCTGLLIAILLLPSILWADAGVSGSAAVNLCESNSYTVDLQNTFGAPAGALVVNASLGGLTGFSYLPGTTAITINGVTSITTADPQINGGLLTWDLDALAGGGTILESGDTLTVDFQLQTACNAVSGTLGAVIDYQIGGAGTSESANMEIQVNPGVATITRTPAVVPAALGDNVTWTISVENTGSGAIENLVVTDLLGDGLTYVSSSPAGSVSGRTVTWDAGNFPALAHMDPGDIVTLDITATVTGTVDLVAAADVRWGCDTGTVCYDSAVAGDTARASVALAVQTPFLDFTPPDIGFTYGAAQETVAFTILNDGDGTAHDIFLSVDVGPLTVSDISAGAAWDPAQKRFALTDALAAGGSYALSFTLNRADWCTGDFPAGDLDWEPLYADDAGNPYRGPVMLSQIDTPIGQPGVTLAVTGAPSVVVIGGSAGYTVTSSGSGITGPVTVTDQVPAGFTVTDTGGGVWSPGGDGTGGQIVWVYDPAASLTAAVTLQAPPAGESAAHCNTTATGTVTAAAPDAAGCTVSETDTWNGRITCGELATSNKTATPDRGDRGTVIAYTNTYTFGGATGALLSDLVFTEAADQGQAYEAGTLAVTFDGGDITGSVAVTDNTAAGGGLILDFSGCGNDSLDGKALSIAYSLRLTANAGSPCTATAFWDGSVLDTDPGGGTIDGQIHNTVAVTVTPPQMTVDIAGLGGTIDKGETRTVTLTVTQTSDVDPRDVKLVLSGLNYQVVNPAATICSGVAPVSCTPAVVGDDTVWTFMDAFAGMGQSTAIQIELMKRCGDDPDLTATAHYDGLIDDDDSIDERCGASQTVAPLLRAGEIHLETAPDTIVATTDTIQYTTYVVNTGSGTASNVWVDNVLGSGLIYEHGVNPVVVDDMTDVTINDSLDHNGFALNGASVEISEMAPGERREITWIARAIDCNNLTADVSAAWGCLGTDCQAPASDSLAVELPDPVVGLTVAATPSGGVDFCAHPQVTTTIENFGTTTVYNNQVTVTLPHGLPTSAAARGGG